MVYDDPLSQKSLEESPNWPPRIWTLKGSIGLSKRAIDEELAQLNFDFEEWLEYKLNVPNDNRPRPHHHPEVEYPLTEEELQALKEEWNLCNPVLCPKQWEESAKQYDEVEKRFWWLGLQEGWVRYGYPRPPDVLWQLNKYTFKTFVPLIYEPFIKWWGEPPDDFWVKLSYMLEQENHRFLHRCFVLLYHSQGKIFPAPDLYELIEDPEPGSLILPEQFWK